MPTLTERARKRLELLDSYTALHQAKASFYVRERFGLSEAELKEHLIDMTTRMQVLVIQHAAMQDLLENSSMSDRCIEEAKERARRVIEQLQEEYLAAVAGKPKSALANMAAVLAATEPELEGSSLAPAI